MAKLTKEQREALAEKRLLSVLSQLTIANQRTLEQKMSDAGPGDQRIDPHILTPVRKRMMAEGVIAATNALNAPWFYASNSSPAARRERLDALLPVYKPFLAMAQRIGDALEVATFRALSLLPDADFSGRFKDHDEHDGKTRYKKEEPPQHIGTRSLTGDERLDFILRTKDAGPLGLECKNVRPWMYPHDEDIHDLLRKCLALDAVPVLIARRIHFSTFAVFSKCGVIVHQTYNQLLPQAEAELAAKVRDKTLLGFHDVRLGNQPDARLVKFVTVNLPKVAAEARTKFQDHKDLLQAYAVGGMDYHEFAGRVLRRWRGENEDGPGGEIEPPPEWMC